MYLSEYYKFAMNNIADDFNSDIEKTINHYGIVVYGINDISIASAFRQAYGHVLRYMARDEFWFCKGHTNGDITADACMLRLVIELRKKLEYMLSDGDMLLRLPERECRRMLEDLKEYERYDGRERALKSARALMACDYKEYDKLRNGDYPWE